MSSNSPKSPKNKSSLPSSPARQSSRPAPVSPLRVFAVTWNMGNAEGHGFEHIFAEKKALEDFDLLVIGLQESTYTKNSNAPFDCFHHLSAQLASCVGAGFYKVDYCHRAQLQMFLFAKTSLKPRISAIEQSIENTGFLHVFPNKGGLLVSLSIDGTRLAFVSCHLTAHEGVKHCEERNASIVEILGGVRVGDQRFDVTEQFHHVFWMGDMNYRLTFSTDTPANTKKNIAELNAALKNAVTAKDVDVEVDGKDVTKDFVDDDESGSEDEEGEAEGAKSAKKAEHRRNRQKVLDMVRAQKWKDLLALDELNREIAAGRVLNQFLALQPSFPPTFKRARNAILPAALVEIDNEHNAAREEERSQLVLDNFYNEKRIPSFTDRILFKSLPAFLGDVKPLFFDSCEAADSSDHKPVRAGFEVSLTQGVEDILVDKDILQKGGAVSGKFLRLKVNQLKGFNLEEMDSAMFGGGSDPYVVITADPPALLMDKQRIVPFHAGVRSKVIKHELNPVWKDELLVDLASLDLEGMSRNASLIFSVWDEDFTNADDLIGVVTFPLKDILRVLVEEKKNFEFESVLRSNTEIMGKLSGVISIEAGSPAKIEDSSNYLSLGRAADIARQQMSEGCCTVS